MAGQEMTLKAALEMHKQASAETDTKAQLKAAAVRYVRARAAGTDAQKKEASVKLAAAIVKSAAMRKSASVKKPTAKATEKQAHVKALAKLLKG